MRTFSEVTDAIKKRDNRFEVVDLNSLAQHAPFDFYNREDNGDILIAYKVGVMTTVSWHSPTLLESWARSYLSKLEAQ